MIGWLASIRNSAAANYELNYYNKHDHQNCKEEMLAFLNMMRTEHAKDLFLNPKMEEFMQGAALNACREGRLVLSFLELDGVKAAAYLSFKNGKALLVYNSAFEPEYFSASPGWVLLAMLIEWAIEQGLLSWPTCPFRSIFSPALSYRISSNKSLIYIRL